jgi:uncharacterized coiled-coil protein SlyX
MKTTTNHRIAKLNASIKLQERTLENLRSMTMADNGETIELTKRIITMLTAQRDILRGVNPLAFDQYQERVRLELSSLNCQADVTRAAVVAAYNDGYTPGQFALKVSLSQEPAEVKPNRIQFNTGRSYTENGQRIVAVEVSPGVVIFKDYDRGIHGKVTRSIRLDRSAVMAAYDSGEYEWVDEYKYRDQLALQA